MKIAEYRWTPAAAYDDDLLLDVQAVTVVYLVRGRNAWHGTWSRAYFKDAHLFADVASAKRAAEERRKQGNVFYVDEVPALLLRGTGQSVVVTDHGSSMPFGEFRGMLAKPVDGGGGRWIGGIFPGVSLRDAVTALDVRSPYWESRRDDPSTMLLGSVAADVTLPGLRNSGESLVSSAQGSDYELGWMRSQRGVPFDSGFAAVHAYVWGTKRDEALRRFTEEGTVAGSFVKYRDQVLSAVPKSVWDQRERERLAAIREVASELYDRWEAADEDLSETELALEVAEADLAKVTAEQFTPAETSAGVRAQRERVEAARAHLSALQTDFAVKEGIVRSLWAEYSSIDASKRPASGGTS